MKKPFTTWLLESQHISKSRYLCV